MRRAQEGPILMPAPLQFHTAFGRQHRFSDREAGAAGFKRQLGFAGVQKREAKMSMDVDVIRKARGQRLQCGDPASWRQSAAVLLIKNVVESLSGRATAFGLDEGAAAGIKGK